MTSNEVFIFLGVALGFGLVLWLYLAVGGLVSRWWLTKAIERAKDRGKFLDSIERASMRDDSVVVGVLWLGTFPYFLVAWSFVGKGIVRFVSWAWRFSFPKASRLPKAKIANREKKS